MEINMQLKYLILISASFSNYETWALGSQFRDLQKTNVSTFPTIKTCVNQMRYFYFEKETGSYVA